VRCHHEESSLIPEHEDANLNILHHDVLELECDHLACHNLVLENLDHVRMHEFHVQAIHVGQVRICPLDK
jgi:hypothetical protein